MGKYTSIINHIKTAPIPTPLVTQVLPHESIASIEATNVQFIPSVVTEKTVPKKGVSKASRKKVIEALVGKPETSSAVAKGWTPSIICIDGRSLAVGLCPPSIDDAKIEEMQRNVNSLLSTLGFRHISVCKQGGM